MKYFKVVYWNDDQFIPITGEELHKAFALSLDENGRGLFSGGMIQGKDIKRIIPDWHREFGWNPSHKLGDDDWNQINPLNDGYIKALEKGKYIAEYAIKNNRMDLLRVGASEAYKQVPQLTEVKVNPLIEEVTKKFSPDQHLR